MSHGGAAFVLLPILNRCSESVSPHTNSSAATSGYERDIGLKSTGGGTPGTLLPYRPCSSGIASGAFISDIARARSRNGADSFSGYIPAERWAGIKNSLRGRPQLGFGRIFFLFIFLFHRGLEIPDAFS